MQRQKGSSKDMPHFVFRPAFVSFHGFNSSEWSGTSRVSEMLKNMLSVVLEPCRHSGM